MTTRPSPRPWKHISLIALSTGALLSLPACWNGSFQTNMDKSKGGTPRFELVIEPKRSDIEASHFLVDSATGDTWFLEKTGAKAGRWVRLATGPADAAELVKPDKKRAKKDRKKEERAAEAAGAS